MASNNPTATKTQSIAPTIPGFTVGGGGGGSTSEQGSFAGIDNPEALAMLMEFLQTSMAGGTPEVRAMLDERKKQIASTRGTLADYTKGSAFSDAAALMAQNLRQSMEKNMPVINKAIQGAGTSASSMQALLSQKLATESAQAAGALGADQAAKYGGISAQLQGVLEALTRVDPTNSNNIVQALNALKTQRSYGSSIQNPTNPTISMTASGGGTRETPVAPAASGIQDGVWYGPGMVPRTSEWVQSTNGLPQVSGGSGGGVGYGAPVASLTDQDLLGIAEDGNGWGGW